MMVSDLDDKELSKVRNLEKDLGTWVVAIDQKPRFAHLSDEQLTRLQAAEQDMGCILLAYDRS